MSAIPGNVIIMLPEEAVLCSHYAGGAPKMNAYEYTYQDGEYIIRTMDTKHAPVHMLYIHPRNHSLYIRMCFPALSSTQDCTQLS